MSEKKESKEIIKSINTDRQKEVLSTCNQDTDIYGEPLHPNRHLIQIIQLHHELKTNKKTLSIECIPVKDVNEMVKKSDLYDNSFRMEEKFIKLPFSGIYVNSRRLDMKKQSPYSLFNTFFLWNKTVMFIGNDVHGFNKQDVYELVPINRSSIHLKLTYDEVYDKVIKNYIFVPQEEDYRDLPILNLEVDIYAGETKDGIKEGWGIIQYKDGSSYEGEWKDNMRDGQGVLYNKDGDILKEGEWDKDEFKSITKSSLATEVKSLHEQRVEEMKRQAGIRPLSVEEEKEIFKLKDVCIQDTYSLLLLMNGRVMTSGRGSSGLLNLVNNFKFKLIPNIIDVRKISCGPNFSFILAHGNNVYSVGNNFHGQLGLGDYNSRTEFTEVNLDLFGYPVDQIVCGSKRTFLILDNSSLASCGSNQNGMLGFSREVIDYNTFKTIDVIDVDNIKCGLSHTVFNKVNGSLYGFGSNEYGQLGLGEEIKEQYEIVVIKENSNEDVMNSFSCGDNHTMIVIGNVLYSTGRNNYGQLGIANDYLDKFRWTQSKFGNGDIVDEVEIVYCGGDKSYIELKESVFLACGDNRNNKLGIPDSPVERINSFYPLEHNFDIYSEGSVGIKVCPNDTFIFNFISRRLWGIGLNENGELGVGNNSNSDWIEVKYLDELKEELKSQQQVEQKSNIKDIKLEREHSLLLLEDGKLFASGKNTDGELGIPEMKESSIFKQIPNIQNVELIAVGVNMSIISTTNQKVYSCGNNNVGQLGVGDYNKRNVFTEAKLEIKDEPIIDLACSDSFTFILLENGELLSSGFNGSGQLGFPRDIRMINEFKLVPDITDINMIDCGDEYVIVLQNGGRIYGCGSNRYGQLGFPIDVEEKFGFTLLNFSEQESNMVNFIACGSDHTMIRIGDVLYGTGDNQDGQLGIANDFNNRYGFTQSKTLDGEPVAGITRIYAKGNKTYIKVNNNYISACGDNENRQLGIPSTGDLAVPEQEDKESNFAELDFHGRDKVIRLGYSGAFIYSTEDDKLYAVGNNRQGQLGLRDEQRIYEWTEVNYKEQITSSQ